MESDSADTSTTELSSSDSDVNEGPSDSIPDNSERCPDTITRHQSLPVIIEDVFEEEETLSKMVGLCSGRSFNDEMF